jgi:hypothetical protein
MLYRYRASNKEGKIIEGEGDFETKAKFRIS